MAFKKGIPYLQQNEESNVRNVLEEKHAYRESLNKSPLKGSSVNQRLSGSLQSPVVKGSPTPITDQKTKDFTENTLKLVQTFLDDEQGDELMLEPCNSYLRKILFETLPTKFPDQILVESRTDEQSHQRHIVVVRGASDIIRKSRLEQARQREENELQSAIGFSRVIKMLSESKKLVVGHNMLLDIFFTIRQFVCALPPCLDDFKALVGCILPRVLDTKLMGTMQPFKDIIHTTALADMNARLREAPFLPADIQVPGKYNVGNQQMQDGNMHEAAYDAYITGSAFLSMVNFLSSFQNPAKPVTSFTSLCNLVSPYVNKIFLMRSHDIPYLNLSGADLTPNRDHVYHVEFPASWRANDLRQLFSPVGQINISWINETRCFIGLYNKGQAKNVLSLMKSNTAEPQAVRISTYKEYQNENSCNVYQSRSQNRVWRSNKNSSNGSTSAIATELSIAPQTCNTLQKPALPSEQDIAQSSTRKRPPSGSAINSSSPPPGYEPSMKRQKSQEDCAAVDESDDVKDECNGKTLKEKLDVSVSSVMITDDLSNEGTKTKTSNNNNNSAGFEVPDEW